MPEPRAVARRLSAAKIDELVAAYKSGTPTTELMNVYSLSKSAVLKALADRGVAMRRQPIAAEQIDQSTRLYEAGNSLAKIAKDLGIPTESIRRALVGAGVTMRPRGRNP